VVTQSPKIPVLRQFREFTSEALHDRAWAEQVATGPAPVFSV
jgi:hypothetical protein